MVKIKSISWAEKDDPMFTGRFTFSSHRNIPILNERNKMKKSQITGNKNNKKLINSKIKEKNYDL